MWLFVEKIATFEIRNLLTQKKTYQLECGYFFHVNVTMAILYMWLFCRCGYFVTMAIL